MRRIVSRAGAAMALSMVSLGASEAAPTPSLKLERVVMLMRHGIRPPTSATPVPDGWTRETWPSWPVDYGLLTPRGAAGVRLLGTADRAFFRTRGLIGAGCPATGAVVIQASGKSRAIKTAENWRDTFLPGCDIAVTHPADKAPDPIFHGLDDKPTSFDGARALREAAALQPTGGLDTELRGYRGDLVLLARVLDCPAPACPVLTEPSRLVGEPHDRPGLTGPADEASSASQTFLLEYLEGLPMKDVGWGRITRPQIEQLLRFHPLKFKYSNRPAYVASVAAAPLALAMTGTMSKPGIRLALFAGHDTNIADLASLLRLHWQVPSYPADDVPPGSALGFEVLRGMQGATYVRAFFRAQTMDQLREQRPLAGKDAPYRAYLPIPGCGDSKAATACTLTRFQALVRQRTADH